jgi:tRNA (adenine57-N1/adenine58-N1)-methyltransferase
MALLRAGADVTGYELRADFAERAMANVAAFLGGLGGLGGPGDAGCPGGPSGQGAAAGTPRYEVVERDVYEGIGLEDLDRIVLDLPEPWRVVPHAKKALRPGGIVCSYVPSVTQAEELRRELAGSGFGLAETFEVLQRTWHIEGRSVRPDLRMVGHTGFITTARLLSLPQR